MTTDFNLTSRFMALFRGREDAFGVDAGGVVHERLSNSRYAAHLNGEAGIGVFPMQDDGTVLFAAIDLDEPDFDLARSMQKLIPGASWLERSRSGNAHVWVFFEAPAPAWAVRAVLRFATEAVGRSDVEIFPKQDRLREGGVGNYVNLAYFGDSRPMLGANGEPIVLSMFVDGAECARQDPDAWARRAFAIGAHPPEDREANTEWGEAPVLHVCAEYIIQGILEGERPVRPGSRHQVLFHLSKQLLNYRGFSQQEAWEILNEVNTALPSPLSDLELGRQFKNATEGRFTSTGCDDPLMLDYVSPDCPIAHA